MAEKASVAVIAAMESMSAVRGCRAACSCAGVGAETADAILKKYPTPASLFKALRGTHASAARQGTAGDAACIAVLACIPVSLSRKAGNAAARAVYDVLYGTDS